MNAAMGHNGGPVMQDRDYQTEAVQSIWNYFMSHAGNPVVAMPTGTGKSVVIARFLQSVFMRYPTQRVLVLTHVKELIQQNYAKLMAVWNFAPAGIYSAGLNIKDHRNPITFAGIASVNKKWAMFGKIDLVIIDEAHLVSPTEETMYQEFINGLKSINPYVKVIGLTATPWRLGHGHICDPVIKVVKGVEVEIPSLFTHVCFDITGIEAFNRLIAEGYLIPLVPKRTRTVLSTDGVHMRGGEFLEKELQTAVDKDEVTWAALQEALELGHDRRKWLIFAAGTDHADHIGSMLEMMGISCGVVHSKRSDRDQVLKDYKAGKLRAVVNNNVLTTGFDDPEIDLIIILRPTMSPVLWVQMLGRGTRPFFYNPMIGHNGGPQFDLNDMSGRLACIAASPKHNCLVLDYAGNTKRLGAINDPVVPRRKGQGGGEAPVKCCDKCNTWVHASLRYCNTVLDDGTVCNNEFVFETKLMQGASSGELISGDMPIVEIFEVEHITYETHEKLGKPPMIRVTYWCGYKKFDEYVCVEHEDFAVRKARKWWRQRTEMEMPTKTAIALDLMDQLPPATHLRVWINKKYPEILATCLDGTAFGTQEASMKEVEQTVSRPRAASAATTKFSRDLDDDIPF